MRGSNVVLVGVAVVAAGLLVTGFLKRALIFEAADGIGEFSEEDFD